MGRAGLYDRELILRGKLGDSHHMAMMMGDLFLFFFVEMNGKELAGEKVVCGGEMHVVEGGATVL